MKDIVLLSASLFGVLAILLGAFGAHALKDKFTKELLQSFETGVKYQMYHAIVLLTIGLHFDFTTDLETYIGLAFIVGVVLFSFSIYGLCFSTGFGKKLKFLGPITPLGGLCLLMGWILLGVKFL